MCSAFKNYQNGEIKNAESALDGILHFFHYAGTSHFEIKNAESALDGILHFFHYAGTSHFEMDTARYAKRECLMLIKV